MPFRLLEDRIAVVAEELPDTTESGLIITESAQSVLRYGAVALVGIGHRSEESGELIPMDVAVGDRVFFHRASGQPLDIEGTEYVFLSPREIIGVCE
jgi:chaperonin GroES